MTNKQLIDLLVADLKPVHRRRILWAIIGGLAIGTGAVFGATLLIFHPRAQLLSERSPDTLLIKVLFASGVAATAALFLPQLTRPETRMRRLPKLMLVPFVAVAATAIVALFAGGVGGLACALPCLRGRFRPLRFGTAFQLGSAPPVGAKLGPSLLRW